MGQKVDQIEPNSVWSISCVIKVFYKRIFCYSLPNKKVSIPYGFHTELFEFRE